MAPTLLRVVRTSFEKPEGVTYAAYDPWFCVACGHPHHGMTRHHRLPKRVAWKIPHLVWSEYFPESQRIAPMCGPCHDFIEGFKPSPCAEARDDRHAKLGYRKLMEEIRLFDKLAYERTEEMIRKCRAGEI